MDGLSLEFKAVVGTVFKAVQFYTENKDKEIHQLKTKVSTLEDIITQLEDQIDDVNQYEKRDTVIISGPDLP